MHGDPLGTHRVLSPPGALPQPAWRLDNDATRRFDSEIVVSVRTLNIDAASFRQMASEPGSGDISEKVARSVVKTVTERGKQHNPVTGSGGMLLGDVAFVGAGATGRGFAVGDRVVTLASLSLTPLALDRVIGVRPASAQIDVEGSAIIFLSAPLARMADDLPEHLALALFDVAGAAPQVERLVSRGQLVVVLGAGGKSGLLVAAAVNEAVGEQGFLVGVERDARAARELEASGFCPHVVCADACDPVALRQAVLDRTGGREADVVFSCVDVPGVEMSAVLLTRERGKVYFFAMSTSFTAAALGAEGIGKDIDMYIGNGYSRGHADHTLSLVRRTPALRAILEQRFA